MTFCCEEATVHQLVDMTPFAHSLGEPHCTIVEGQIDVLSSHVPLYMPRGLQNVPIANLKSSYIS